MEDFYNCHIHTFTGKAVPSGFLPLGLMRLLTTAAGSAVARFALGKLWPFKNHDRFDRVAALVGIGSLPNQEAIFLHAAKFYPPETRFVVLPMDMDYMEAGEPPQPYLAQLNELQRLKKKYGQKIIPFVAADPRRPDLFKLVRTYLEEYDFGGIKLYPPLGFYPFAEPLGDLYQYAQERQVPILTHCSRGGVYYQGRITERMRTHPKTGEKFTERRNQEFTDHYADPSNYRHVLAEYPELKICLAHYGGDDEWHAYLDDPWPDANTAESWLSVISNLMRSYKNVYSDIAYTAHERRFWPLIKVLMNTPVLQERIVYGSDYYLVRLEGSERAFSLNLRGAIGEPEFLRLAATNAAAFLKQG